MFNEKISGLKIIKKAIRRDLESLAEEGIKWLVFTGNLGFEYWVLDVANEMKEDYDFSLATILILKHTGKIGMKRISLNLANLRRSILSNMPIPNMNIKGQLRDYQRFYWKIPI